MSLMHRTGHAVLAWSVLVYRLNIQKTRELEESVPMPIRFPRPRRYYRHKPESSSRPHIRDL